MKSFIDQLKYQIIFFPPLSKSTIPFQLRHLSICQNLTEVDFRPLSIIGRQTESRKPRFRLNSIKISSSDSRSP